MNPFYDHYKHMATSGGGFDRDIGNIYRGVLYQRGYGLDYDIGYDDVHGLGFASNLMGMFKFVLPALKTGLQYLGKQAVSTAANIATDAIAGKNIADSAKGHVTDVAENLFAKAPEVLSAVIRGGQKRKWVSSPETGEAGTSIRSVRRAPYNKKRKGRYITGRGLLSTYPILAKFN